MKAPYRHTHRDVARHFSAAAEDYDTHAGVQMEAASHLLRLIPVCTPERILDLGCGTGLMTVMLRGRWPGALVTAIDAAPGMVARAKERLPGCHVHVADIACLARHPVFDLVISNCALQWVSPFETGIARMAEQVRPGGVAALSVMLDGTLRELHEARRMVAPGNPPLGRMPAGEEVIAALSRAGMDVAAAEQTVIVRRLPSVRDVLAALRAQGVTGGHLARGARGLTRRELARLEEVYTHMHGDENGVAVTYRVGCYVAGKPS